MKTFLIVFAVSLFSSSGYLLGQANVKPDLPQLGFGVRDNGAAYQNDLDQSDWWPDARIWTVPSRVKDKDTVWKEILVPVFIVNKWHNYNNEKGLVFDEISSFAFRVYYDERVLEFVGLTNQHPFTKEEAMNFGNTRFASSSYPYYNPLSEHFNLTAADEKVNDYFKYFDVKDINYDLRNSLGEKTGRIGRRVTINGTANSFYNLPYNAPDEFNAKKVLVYLRFKVLPTTTSLVSQQRISKMYFDPGYICYNGVNIAKDFGARLLKDFPTNPADPNYNNYKNAFVNANTIVNRNDNMLYYDESWPAEQKYIEIEKKSVGIQNYSNYNNINKYIADPYLPGSINVNVMDDYLEFDFKVLNENSVLPASAQIVKDTIDPTIWIMKDPIAADSLAGRRANYNNKSERAIDVTAIGGETMENIIIETDQHWLKVRSMPFPTSIAMPEGYEPKFPDLRRRAFVQRINNRAYTVPFNVQTGTQQNLPKKFRLFIECDQTGMIPGEYVGYVTFKSEFDKNEVTKILVKFIVMDYPVERNEHLGTVGGSETPFGIVLKLTPFNGTTPEKSKILIMGSATKATDLVDSLYGEYPHSQPLGFSRFGVVQSFDARFFIDSNHYKQPNPQKFPKEAAAWNALVRNGFGDYTHLDGITNPSANDNKMARSNSRDIRSSIPSDKSHVYYVKFKYETPNVDYYPVVLEWDANQFWDSESQSHKNTVFLKYLMNGVEYTRDMRTEGTPIGNNKYTFTFTDKSVQEFWIEYTIGQVQTSNLVDNFGDPIIMANGWNFVSLPLSPVNTDYKYVFRNALNIPYQFFLNGWQPAKNGILQPGIGYFVKYQTTVDKQFSGAHFYNINKDVFPVRVYAGDKSKGGWNAIGALSVKTDASKIDFDTFNGEQPDPDYTKRYGVWAYRSNKGYVEVPALFPGKAYWIKTDKNGYLNIKAYKKAIEMPTALVNKTTGFDQITIADVAQNSANIYVANNVDVNNYQLPPVPPSGLFDVRFSRDNYVANYEESTVLMQGVTYPVTVNFENPRANYTVTDPETGFVYGEVKAGNNANITINNARANAFKLTATASNETFFVTVAQNPVTTNNAEITFAINQDADVNIAIFNAIGNEITKIEAGNLTKGIYNKNIDVSKFQTGSYTVRLTAGNESKIFRMNIVK